MPSVIKPLSDLDPSVISEYLVRQGNDDAGLIAWKYFDTAFNRNRERGFACVDGSKITAFIGLIPFTVCIGGEPLSAAWSCDWYRDPASSGPQGVMLMKRGLQTYNLLYSLGGSAATRAIMPRLSQLTVADAGVELHLPLRAGGALRALSRVAGFRLPKSIPVIDSIPMPWLRRSISESAGTVVTGISDGVSSVLKSSCEEGAAEAYYTLDDLRWLLERCPVLTTYTALAPVGAWAKAGVLFWRPALQSRFWRLAPLYQSNAIDDLRATLRQVIRKVYEEDGWMISALVSRFDSKFLDVLKKEGFVPGGKKRPLYVLSQNRDVQPPELKHLSYLDTDYAYRFSLQ